MKTHPPASLSVVIAMAALGCAPPSLVTPEDEGSATNHIERDGEKGAVEGSGEDAPSDPGVMRRVMEQLKEDAIAMNLADAELGVEPVEDDGNAGTKSLHPRTVAPGTNGIVQLFDSIGMRISGTPICRILRPFKTFEHPFFFGGVQGTLSAGVTGAAGFEAVVDVYNSNAAVYGYLGGGISAALGVSVGLYSGVGFDRNARVGAGALDEAWHGVFLSATGSAGVEELIDGSFTGFVSRDGTVFGGAVGASAGVGVTPASFANLTGLAANYTLHPEGTRRFWGGDGAQVHFANAAATAQAVLRVSPGLPAGALGSSAIATLTYVGTLLHLKDQNHTITSMCPDR